MSAIWQTLLSIIQNSGFTGLAQEPLYIVMLVVGCFLLYLAIVRGFEPLLLLPIAFGMILANLPGSNIIHMQYFIGVGDEVTLPDFEAMAETISGAGMLLCIVHIVCMLCES